MVSGECGGNIHYYLFQMFLISFPSFFKYFIFFYFQREGKGRRKRGRETSMCGCSHMPPTRDQARNPGMCPDWESNRRPLVLQACTQSTELHQPGPFLCFLLSKIESYSIKFTEIPFVFYWQYIILEKFNNIEFYYQGK